MPPIRTCVVCREKTDPDDLVRLALAPDETVVVDFRGNLPGRGGWCHAACLPVLEQKPGMLKRALKQNVPSAPWVEQYRSALIRALEDGLSLAASAGALVGGNHLLTEALKAGQLVEVLLSSDIAPGSEKKIVRSVPEGMPVSRLHLTTAELGARVGKGERAALGVRRSRASTHLLRQLRRLRSLG